MIDRVCIVSALRWARGERLTFNTSRIAGMKQYFIGPRMVHATHLSRYMRYARR
jgi:hypothetical protein